MDMAGGGGGARVQTHRFDRDIRISLAMYTWGWIR